jgi:hypothetical protein
MIFPDYVFASETHKKRGIYRSGLARECELNKENLRGQARSYATLLKQRHYQVIFCHFLTCVDAHAIQEEGALVAVINEI